MALFMALVDEIIDLATDDRVSVAALLRKCLVLAHALKNQRLREWVEAELNGYAEDDPGIPGYRKTSAPAKGNFAGSFGATITNRPLPSAALRDEHRFFADSVVLIQPIASYEGVDRGRGFVVFQWPPNLTLLYQRKKSLRDTR